MVYKGEVSSATELGALTDLSIGHTYVVSAAFGAYSAGDLLVANGTEVDGKITAESLTWDHVTTGYDADLEQTITTADGKIQLTSAIGANNGQIAFESKKDANNNTSALVVEVANNTVTIGMVWEDFE